MRYIKYISIIILTSFLFSCEETSMPLFDAENSFVFIESGSYLIAENSTAVLEIPVVVAGVQGADVEVTFEVKGAGSNPAVEGVDFQVVNAGKKVKVAKGCGTAKIQIRPINNDQYTKDKSLTVELVSNTADFYMDKTESGNTAVDVTITDDEHPLAKWIGVYDVAAVSYGSPGEWDEAWVVTISPSPENENTLLLKGIGATTGTAIKAIFNVTDKTITIKAGQVLGGDVYGYGDIDIVYATPDFDYDPAANIVGTISDDGTMLIDNWGHLMTGEYADYGFWDVFNTTWTKQ